MDNKSGKDAENPKAVAAHKALKQLQDDESRLAAQLVTPRWYYPTLGVFVATFAFSQALPGAATLWTVAIGITMLPILTTTYSHRYGISMMQATGPRSKHLLLVILTTLLLAMASSLAIKIFALPLWWAFVPATIAFFCNRHARTTLRQCTA